MKQPRKHIVMYSGGLRSWATAWRVVNQYGPDNITLLFQDTQIEDEDTYRFLEESADDLCCELVKTAEGRDVWQVFFDTRFIGNTRADPCSRILKREVATRWVKENCDPEHTTIYLGFDWEEQHRLNTARRFWSPYQVESPLVDERPIPTVDRLRKELAHRDIELPRMYRIGATMNCGGFCVKQGQAQFAKLLEVMPGRYRYHETKENQFRFIYGKDVSIMRDRRGGVTKTLTMKQHREQIEAGKECTLFDGLDAGSCGCFDYSEDMQGDTP